jgi:hypothetical protein
MSDTPNQTPFGGRWFIPAAIVVAIVVVIAIVIAVTNIGHGKNTTTPTSAPTHKTSTAIPAGAKSVCGLKGYETTSSLDSAPKTTWQLVGTFAAPTDRKGAGPGEIDSTGFRSCYAHTAEGALYAAVNFTALSTDASTYSKIPTLVVPGPGREAAIKQEAAETGQTSSGPRAQLAGFEIDSYTASAATVDLALSYDDGTTASAPLKLQWSGGDWKIVLADDGSFPLAPAALQNLGGYTPWSGA